MSVPYFQLDAFANRRFAGNPAAVLVFEAFPADEVLRAIAAESNLTMTAFIVRTGGDYHLRWFTPVLEVPLCGHATLASAAVVMERLEPGRQSVVFQTASGMLPVARAERGYSMDFPARPSEPVVTPSDLAGALGVDPIEVYENEFSYLARLESEVAVRTLAPDLAAVARLRRMGVIVTAASDGGPYDFVSRYFAPAKGVPEDPVTGTAHCMLAPYWSRLLGKTAFRSFQASVRGGELDCRLDRDRVVLTGACVFYLEGEVTVR